MHTYETLWSASDERTGDSHLKGTYQLKAPYTSSLRPQTLEARQVSTLKTPYTFEGAISQKVPYLRYEFQQLQNGIDIARRCSTGQRLHAHTHTHAHTLTHMQKHMLTSLGEMKVFEGAVRGGVYQSFCFPTSLLLHNTTAECVLTSREDIVWRCCMRRPLSICISSSS